MSDNSIHKRTFILTGARRDFTGRLGQYDVEAGRIKLMGNARDLLAWERHIEVMYQGFPLGDERIETMEQAIADAYTGEGNGQGGLPAGQVLADGKTDVHGDDASRGAGSAETAAVGGVAGAGAPGSSDATTSGGDGQQTVVTPQSPKRLVDALEKLDDANDDHWTQAGLPAIEALTKMSGIQTLTRAMIAAASPRRRAMAN